MRDDSKPNRRTVLRGLLAASGTELLSACGIRLNEPRSKTCNSTDNPATANWAREFQSSLAVDAHCHTFNALDLPIDGFIRALAHGEGVPAFLDATVRQATARLHGGLVEAACSAEQGTLSASAQAAINTALDELDKKLPDAIAGLKRAAIVAAQARRQVLTNVASTCSEVSLFMPALVDYAYWEDRARTRPVYPTNTTLWDQVRFHGRLFDEANAGRLDKAAGRSDKRAFSVHGYVPFNPLRQVYDEQNNIRDEDTALGIVKKALGLADGKTPLDVATTTLGVTDPPVGLGYLGVKLYPACGFLPTGNARLTEFGEKLGSELDDALDRLYEFCEANDVPILAHANESNGFGKDYAWRGSPWAWREVLEAHEDLRLNLGHFGHTRGLDGRTCVLSCLAWAEMIAKDLMEKYPHVYADNSFSAIIASANEESSEARDKYVAVIRALVERHPVVKQRLLYGTDWWMTEFDLAAKNHGGKSEFYAATEKSITQILTTPDERAAYFGKNTLQFLGILDDAGAVDEASPVRERLVAYYTSLGCPPEKLPTWLGQTP